MNTTGTALPPQPFIGAALSNDGLISGRRQTPWESVVRVRSRRTWFGAVVSVIDTTNQVHSLRFSSVDKAHRALVWIEERIYEPVRQRLNERRMTVAEMRAELHRLLAAEPPDARPVADLLLAQGLFHRASDVHLEPGQTNGYLRMRVSGAFVPLAECSPAMFQRVLNRIKVLAGIPTHIQGQPLESRLPLENWRAGADARVTVLPTVHGDRAALRFHAEDLAPKELAALGLPGEALAGLSAGLQHEAGLILVTGPANSGKTTTLYACLRHVIQRKGHATGIFTVEDPVECRLPGAVQTAVDPQHGIDYIAALRNILRQDPEVLMIGEIRDRETAAAAIQASLTGHLVLSSLHCGSPAEAIIRLLDMGFEPYRISSSVRGVLNQRLRPVPCGCDGADGCPSCPGTGVKGRRAEGEWFEITEAVRRLILDRPMIDDLEALAAASSLPAAFDPPALLPSDAQRADYHQPAPAGHEGGQK